MDASGAGRAAPREDRAGRPTGRAGSSPSSRREADGQACRDPRIQVWQPSQKLPWHLAFYGVTVVTLLAVLPDFEPGGWPGATWGGVAALVAVALAYSVLLVPGEPRMGGGRVVAYLIIMVLGLSVAIACVSFATLMLFIGFTHTWALTGRRGMGTAFTGALALGAGTGLAITGGTPTMVAVGVAVAAASFAFSVLMGLSILSLVQRSFERQRLAVELAEARQQLAEVHWAERISAQREHIAQDIHDTLAQGFTSIVMLAQVARGDVVAGRAESAEDRLRLIEQTARDNLAEARALVAADAPLALAQDGLAAAISRLAARFEAETGVAVAVSADDAADGGDRARDVALLRACQEALANIRKHAHATHAVIALRVDEAGVCLTVSDDGVGLGAEATPGIGLESMAARARALGGSLDLRPAGTGPGTVLQLRLPVDPPGADDEAPFGAAGGAAKPDDGAPRRSSPGQPQRTPSATNPAGVAAGESR